MTTLKEYYAQKSGSWQELAEAQDDEIDRLRGIIEYEMELRREAAEQRERDKAEIERLRSLVKEEQGDDLTTAYMTGFHKRDDEVAALKAEIERLRDAAVIARTTHANLHEEIERLRGLLREIGEIGWREALGD